MVKAHANTNCECSNSSSILTTMVKAHAKTNCKDMPNSKTTYLEPVVLGEPLDVQNKVARQCGDAEALSDFLQDHVGVGLAVELGKDVRKRYLHRITSHRVTSDHTTFTKIHKTHKQQPFSLQCAHFCERGHTTNHQRAKQN